jgi:CheY-like chemotaxis protein
VAKVRASLQVNAPFALVLMDRHMPGMDGLETTRQIRSEPGCRALPIVAMTADVVGSAHEECLLAGMNDFVSKPFSPESLFPVVVRWVVTENIPSLHEAKTPTPGPDHDSLPSTLPGLDIKEGLSRMGGNRTRR